MSNLKKTCFLIAALLPSLAMSAAVAEPGVTNASQTGAPDLGALERRYFGRVYDKDATDKRIQRIELLLFGATQDGGLVERLDRVQQSAAERSKSPKTGAAGGTDTASIAAIERKILKKSFDSETPAQRLSRLESKVFGQASPSMSIGDRVFRLKKILNVETPSISRVPSMPEMNGMGGLGSIGGLGSNGDLLMPFNSFSYAPFANGRPDEMAQQMNEMIKQLNKSLRGLHKLPDGAPNVAPFNGPGLSPFGGPNGSPFGGPSGPNSSPFSGPNGSPFSGPNGTPFGGPSGTPFGGQNGTPFSGPNLSPFTGPNETPFVQPFRTVPQQGRDNELPPYLDPNSI